LQFNDNLLAASPNKGIKRIMGKILQFIARKFPFLPPQIRAFLQQMRGVKFSEYSAVFIGEDVYFDDMYPELISIGRKVIITEGVRILSHFVSANHERTSEAPFFFYKGAVEIGDNVFIGMNTAIVKPIKIGSGSMIGANSVLTKDVPENSIMVGSPARQVGTLRSVPR